MHKILSRKTQNTFFHTHLNLPFCFTSYQDFTSAKTPNTSTGNSISQTVINDSFSFIAHKNICTRVYRAQTQPNEQLWDEKLPGRENC